MIIELTNSKVHLKEALTWGDMQKIQRTTMAGAKIKDTKGNFDFDATAVFEAKYVTLECSVEKVVENEEEKPFTRAWMDALSMADGTKLEDAVDEMTKKND